MYGEGKKKSDKYVGQFRDGMFHGRGEYYSSDGSKFTGLLFYYSGENKDSINLVTMRHKTLYLLGL